MRIVAGSRKGHRISAPKGAVTRPTGDRVREAAFALLGSVEDDDVLDLFAGSGAMGLEALSRGAASCVFVERSRSACRVIDGNLEKLGFEGHVLCRDAVKALREQHARKRRFDLVLVDAPYEEWARYEKPLGRLVPDVLEPDGRALVETAGAVQPTLPLDLVTTRRYGSARLTLFEK